MDHHRELPSSVHLTGFELELVTRFLFVNLDRFDGEPIQSFRVIFTAMSRPDVAFRGVSGRDYAVVVP